MHRYIFVCIDSTCIVTFSQDISQNSSFRALLTASRRQDTWYEMLRGVMRGSKMVGRSRTQTQQHKMAVENSTEFKFRDKNEGINWYQCKDALERYFWLSNLKKLCFDDIQKNICCAAANPRLLRLRGEAFSLVVACYMVN